MVREILNTLTAQGKRSLFTSIIFFVVYALCGVFMMLVVLAALTHIMDSKTNLLPYFIALILCLLTKGFSNIIADKQKHYAGFDLVYEVRKKILLRLKRFSLGFYTNERLGEISTIIHKDVDNMEMVVGHLWPRMCADFTVSSLLFIFMMFLDYRMGLLMASLIPIALILLVLSLKKAKNLERENENNLADVVSLFVEYVKGIPLLKAFSESKKFDNQLEDATKRFGTSSKTASKNKAKILSLYGFLIDCSFGIMFVGGVFFLYRDMLSPLVFLIFVVISREFYKPFFAMETHYMNYLKVTTSFCRIKKITGAPVVKDPAFPKTPDSFAVAFENVSFTYENDSFMMKNVSFKAPSESLTALVGPSGSGKTTITNLLLRFWDVSSGSVSIGGVDVKDLPYDELLNSISIVMQNVQLFADTIEGNIAIGKKGATEEEIILAAKKARIHDFIMSLPQNYKTKIGENGVGLSGGQKQRISIARAFLKNAPILILDEITSNVDPVNEALIQEAISALAKNRTVFVIAHHLHTIRSADQILVFQNGQLTEQGDHDDLLAQKNIYHNLWHIQKGARQ